MQKSVIVLEHKSQPRQFLLNVHILQNCKLDKNLFKRYFGLNGLLFIYLFYAAYLVGQYFLK